MIGAMKDFKKYSGAGKSYGDKGRSDSTKSYGGSNSRSGGDSKSSYHKSDTTMYDATCSDCGKACQVPFRPVGSKPIKCRDCFVDKREGQEHTFSNKYTSNREGGGNRDGGNTYRKDTGNKGYTDNRSEGATLSAVDQKAISDMKVQIDSLHTKINAILDILNK